MKEIDLPNNIALFNVRHLFKEYFDAGFVLSGGSARAIYMFGQNKDIISLLVQSKFDDFDFYAINEDAIQWFKNPKNNPIMAAKNNIAFITREYILNKQTFFNCKTQFMCKTHEKKYNFFSCQSIMDSFDIENVKIVITKDKIYCSEQFEKYNEQNIVHVGNTENSSNLVRRLFKYIRRGLSPDPSQKDYIMSYILKDIKRNFEIKKLKSNYKFNIFETKNELEEYEYSPIRIDELVRFIFASNLFNKEDIMYLYIELLALNEDYGERIKDIFKIKGSIGEHLYESS